MSPKRAHTLGAYAGPCVIAALVAFFALGAGVAHADTDVPSTPLFEGGVWSTGGVAIMCVVVVIVVIVGVVFIRRARAKRRASGPGAGS
jgi:heme/copper-type cytochrome/quinol oxidase subunit 2